MRHFPIQFYILALHMHRLHLPMDLSIQAKTKQSKMKNAINTACLERGKSNQNSVPDEIPSLLFQKYTMEEGTLSSDLIQSVSLPRGNNA